MSRTFSGGEDLSSYGNAFTHFEEAGSSEEEWLRMADYQWHPLPVHETDFERRAELRAEGTALSEVKEILNEEKLQRRAAEQRPAFLQRIKTYGGIFMGAVRRAEKFLFTLSRIFFLGVLPAYLKFFFDFVLVRACLRTRFENSTGGTQFLELPFVRGLAGHFFPDAQEVFASFLFYLNSLAADVENLLPLSMSKVYAGILSKCEAPALLATGLHTWGGYQRRRWYPPQV